MIVLGSILIVAAFLVGVYGGIMLSLPSVMRSPSGEISQSKQTFYAVLLALCAIVELVGIYFFTH